MIPEDPRMQTTPTQYAGDIEPEQAYTWQQQGQGVLVDVRTDAERDWVGLVPGAVPLCWRIYPGMVPNPDFDAQVLAIAQQHPGQRLLFICRSGVRSVGAAQRATELGLGGCYNVLEGFEGDLDGAQQRGHRGGWRFRGLPWIQK